MLRVFLRSFVEAWNDNVPRLGASLAFYNTHEEIEALAQGIRKAQRMLG